MADDGISLGIDLDFTGGDDGLNLLRTLDRMDKTLRVVDMRLDKVTGASSHAAKAHGQHAEGLKGLGLAFDRVITQGMDPFLHKAKEIAEFEFIREGAEKLLEFPGELAEKVGDLGKEMVLTAAKAERFDAAFKSALGEEAAKKMLAYTERVASHTEFTRNQIKGMQLDLAHGGFKGAGLVMGFEAAIDMASMSGNAQEGANSAIEALRRVMTSGKLELRSLMPFGINQGQFLGELSKETGLGMTAVKKQLEEGKIAADTVLNSLYVAITQKTHKALGDAGADMEGLLSTRLKNLLDLKDVALERFGNTAAFTKLSDSMANIFNYLDPTKEPGKHIFHDVERVFERLPLLIEMSIKALKLLGVTAAVAAGPIAPIVAIGTGRVLLDKEQRKDAANAVNLAVYGKSTAEIEKMGFFGKLGTGVAGFGRTVAGIVTGHHYGKAAADGLAKGMGDGIPTATDAAQKLGKAADKGLRDQLEVHSPSRVFLRIGEMTTAGFVDGIERSAHSVDMAVGRMVTIPTRTPAERAGPRGMQVVVEVGGVHVNAQTNADPQQIADQVAAKLENEISPMLLAGAIEALALQTGSNK